jgi:hypothetical protein
LQLVDTHGLLLKRPWTAIISIGHNAGGSSVSIEIDLNKHFFVPSHLNASFPIALVGAFIYIGFHAIWIFFYVLAGPMPNNKTKVNETHRNWKPYSVSSELIELLAQSSTSSTNH